MKKQEVIKRVSATIVLVFVTSIFAVGKPETISLTSEGKKLEAYYSKMEADLRAEITRLEPKVDEKKKAEFAKKFGTLESVPPVKKVVMGNEVAVKYGPDNPAFVEKQKEVVTAARVVMKDIDKFLIGEKALATMAKFALLIDATPGRLAEFSQKGKDEKALIDKLLNDDGLVVQIMTMGGASGGDYGQAMRSYTAIQKASPRSHEGFFQSWALAVSLQYTGETYVYPDAPAADSLVKYYMNYLKAYDNRILDPAFSELGGTGWNYRFVFPDSYTLEDIDWMRKVLRNYRPDHTRLEYRWRYCRIVKTDIPYTGGVDRSGMPAELSNIQKFFLEGGICGPRAFVGQISGYAFGIPSRRAPSPGHGAMAHWTPDGWTTVLGPHFYFCSHINGMNPMEFLLESQAQQDPVEYKKALMCEWLGKALAEDVPSDYGSSGGFWRLLGFYKRQAIVEDQEIEDIGTTGEELAESNVTTVKEDIEEIEISEEFRQITTDADGIITIPVAACRSPKNGEKIRFMESIDGGMQVHYGLGGRRPELLNYTLDIPKAGKYEFTGHVCSVTMKRDFLLRINRRTLVNVNIPYTKADWMDTEPIELDLKAGANRISFTQKAPNKGVSIKYFKLKPME